MSNKKVFKKGEGTSIIAVIGDEDTVTGFLLTGIGERNLKGETNFIVVESSKSQASGIIFNFYHRY